MSVGDLQQAYSGTEKEALREEDLICLVFLAERHHHEREHTKK